MFQGILPHFDFKRRKLRADNICPYIYILRLWSHTFFDSLKRPRWGVFLCLNPRYVTQVVGGAEPLPYGVVCHPERSEGSCPREDSSHLLRMTKSIVGAIRESPLHFYFSTNSRTLCKRTATSALVVLSIGAMRLFLPFTSPAPMRAETASLA